MRILYLGSPEFAVPPLEALLHAGYHIVGVVTQPDRPAGRKRVLTPPPVCLAAQQAGLPVFQPASLRDPAAVEQLAAFQPDIGIVAAYGEILRKAVLNIPPLGYLNIHPSLLPRHRGPAPVSGAILAGDTETGVTIMQLGPGMDSGPIVVQERVPLPPDARAGPLTDDLFRLGAKKLIEVLPGYVNGQIVPHPQDDSQATITRMLKKADGEIDWTQPAVIIERLTRAYDPWPGAYTTWRGQNFAVLAARVHEIGLELEPEPEYEPGPEHEGSSAPPGTIIRLAQGPLVTTGSGLLELLEVQPAGKRPMDGRDWFNGQRDAMGQQFETMFA